MKRLLKGLRAFPPLNVPATYVTRWLLWRLGRRSEPAISHLPHVGITRMNLPGGRRARLWSRGDDWVSNQVFWRGWDGYEPEMTPLFWRHAEQARVTLDIGAHVGFYAILAATANAGGSVFAFEPLPAVFARLQRNLALNGLANATALCTAVGNADGAAEFFHVPGIIPCSSSLSESYMRAVHDAEPIPVPVTRLDTFLASRNVEVVDLVKIDTETTEPDVLAGMGDLLSSQRPDIFCEVLPDADGDALAAILRPLGYRFFHLTGQGPELRECPTGDPVWLNYLFTARETTCDREGRAP